MNVKLIGSFVFINQGYGVLSSVYHNNIDTEPFPETAKRKSSTVPVMDPFDGDFTTIWLETGHQEDITDLKIIRESNGTYTLTWFNAKRTWYYGIGFIHDNKLVGAYWQNQEDV